MSEDKARLRTALFQLIRSTGEHGVTDEELTTLAALNNLTIVRTSVGARRNELYKEGLVVDSGDRRLSRANRSCIVWVAA